MQIYPVTNAHHGDLYVLHNYLSCHPGWVKLYFGWVKSFTTILKLCVWLAQVISKGACRNVPWKVQVGQWVFRNKPFAIVALWWLKNSWNWCALFFNISVWFGTFEEKIISELNLVYFFLFPSCQQTWLIVIPGIAISTNREWRSCLQLNYPNPRYIFPGGRSMKTSHTPMFLNIAARVWGQHWHT